MKRLLPALPVGIMLLTAGGVFAADPVSTAPVFKEGELTAPAVQVQRKSIVANAMELSEEEGRRFWPVYEEYRAAMDGVAGRMTALLNAYAEQRQHFTDIAAKELVDGYLDAEAARLKIKKQYVEKFREALPWKKVMRLYQIENKMDALVSAELAKKIPLAP